ncbi:MAG TPA: hypothetical protein G4N94_05445 [Caldilineae bacterium]|nr:hypothetical protein [Caldilineae bacterium]
MKRNHTTFLVLAVALAIVWFIALLFVPPEQTLGALLRWVFAHASLTQVSLLLFLAAAILAGLYLLGRKQLWGWMEITGWMALGLWLAGFLLSMIPAKLSWGVWVDFHEPRTQMTLRVLAVGIIFLALTRWVDHPRFTAGAQIIFSALVLFLNRNAGVIRHPLNPIGSSGSNAIPLLYSLIFVLALASSIFFIAYMVGRRQTPPVALTA